MEEEAAGAWEQLEGMLWEHRGALDGVDEIACRARALDVAGDLDAYRCMLFSLTESCEAVDASYGDQLNKIDDIVDGLMRAAEAEDATGDVVERIVELVDRALDNAPEE
jgi:hypothetical protein